MNEIINEEDIKRRFKNLISTTQLLKKIAQCGYEGNYTEQAIYILLDKYGIKEKTIRRGKKYFNRKNACDCIERHIFELREIATDLEKEKNVANNAKENRRQTEDDVDWGSKMNPYARNNMSVASRELLANDGVFGADENELYKTNEDRKTIRISENSLKLFDIVLKKR